MSAERDVEEAIRRLHNEIKMIRSHQNESNYYLLEDMIAARILMIMELEEISFEKK